MKSMSRAQIAAVIVAALGYFVDVYDLILFSIVRVESLKSLGVQGADLMTIGMKILNFQMIGMLLGGLFWGIRGDRKGRLSVLFGSILMYSLANIANGFITDVNLYAWLRLIAGIGLAGEIGAGITLVSELMPKEKRGLATTVVASIGVCGAIAAALIGDVLPWRTAFFIGGGLGLSLLVLRVSVHESGLFEQLESQAKPVRRGDVRLLFSSWDRFRRYACSILSGVPIWCGLGILVALAPELGQSMGLAEPVSAGRAIMCVYIGFVLGDLASGLLSQVMKSRRNVLLIFIALSAVTSALYILWPHASPNSIYWLAVPLGVAIGYWAVFITAAAEQFGTNLRSTVATTVPNFVRGAVPLLNFGFQAMVPGLGVRYAGLSTMMISIVIAALAVLKLEDTFHKDLDFVEVG